MNDDEQTLAEMFILGIRCDLCGIRFEERDEFACGEPDYLREHSYEIPTGVRGDAE